MTVSSFSPERFSVAAAPHVLQLSPSLTMQYGRRQQIQLERREETGEGAKESGLYRGRRGSVAVSCLLLASVLAVLFLVSRCFSLSRQQQQQLLLLQSVRRLAAEKGTGEETGDGGDSNFVERMCEEERGDTGDEQRQIATSTITYGESDRVLELGSFTEGGEVEEIEEHDNDVDGKPPPRKKRKGEEIELQNEEGSLSLAPSFAFEMHASASPTAEAAAQEGAAAADIMRADILKYVEEILAEENDDSEGIEDDLYFGSLISELNMIVGTQFIDEMPQQQQILQQQQQGEGEQQVLIDEFNNTAHSAILTPANADNNSKDYGNGRGEETGKGKGGEEDNGEEVEENEGTADDNNDDDNGSDRNDHTDDTDDDNNNGSGAGGEGAADDEENKDDADANGKNNDNSGDAAAGDDADTVDDNGYADAEDNDGTGADPAVAVAAADDGDDIGGDSNLEEGEVQGIEIETKPERAKETKGEKASSGESEYSQEEGYDVGRHNRHNLPDDNGEDDDDEDSKDSEDTETADETSPATTSFDVAADYDSPSMGGLVVEGQQRRRTSSRSQSGEAQTLNFSLQTGPSILQYQGVVIVDPVGRLPGEVTEEMRKRRKRRGRKELSFKKQFVFVSGKPNTRGAYMIVCQDITYEGNAALLLFWMPFLDPTVGDKKQQRQWQQELQRQNLDDHPFFRLPSVSPSASVRSFRRGGVGILEGKSITYEVHALLAMKDMLKKQQPLTSKDLLKLLEILEQLVEFAMQQGGKEVDHIRPAHAVRRLGAAVLMADAMFAAAEVLGDKAKKDEWWNEAISALPVYRQPTVAAAARRASQQSLKLTQLLQSALHMYRQGQRPPSPFLVPLKQILLCTLTVPGMSKGAWRNFQPDDEEWQQQQQRMQQQAAQ